MSDNKSKGYSHEPNFEGGTKEIKSHFFYYGRGMQKKCLASSKMYLNFIGTKFGESVKQSIELDCLVVTEMASPTVYKDEAEFNKESWSVKKDWESDRIDYRKIVRQINQDLSKSYSYLWQQCTGSLHTIIKRDSDFVSMNPGDVMVLYRVIQRICHGSTNNANCFMAAMESVYNFHLIKGDEYADSSSYLESFEKRYEIIERVGISYASVEMRDLYIKELEEKRMTDHPSYKKMIEWRAAQAAIVNKTTWDPQAIVDGMEAINQKYKAYVFVKRAGFKYENFRIELEC